MTDLIANSGSHLQVLIPVLFICTAFIIPLLYHWYPEVPAYLSVAVLGVGFFLSWMLFRQVTATTLGFLEYFPGHSWSGQRFLGTGQPIGVVVRTDLFGSLLVLLITGVGLLVSISPVQYVPHSIKPHKMGYYYSLVLLMMAGMVGICLTGDFFNFYVFLEVGSISSYALVAISDTKRSYEASLKYMMLGALGSILILFGVAMLFSATGTLNMAYAAGQISKILSAAPTSHLADFKYLIYASLGLFVIGFCIKSAFFPTHAWLADAHPAAPSSISALLSGLVIKATGAFLFIRFLFSVFGFHKNDYGAVLSPLFLILAVFTIIGGSIFAIAQSDLKRMLAFSTIAQMGYILVGIGLLTPAGLEGSILHIINHALIKSMLFLCAGAVIYKTGIRNIYDMTRIGYRMPITMGCFTIGALAMVGVPPLNGFMSKLALTQAAMKAGMPFVVGVLLISSLLNAVYYFRVVGIAFFGFKGYEGNGHGGEGDDHHSAPDASIKHSDARIPWAMAVPMVILAFSLFYFGLKVGMLRGIIKPAVQILWS